MAEDAEDAFSKLPSDAFVDILQRLPTSSRRRFRLVCKHWRDAVDERTAERQVRTKILAFISKRASSRAIVFDDRDGHRRRDWTYSSSYGFVGVVKMVGTCNGLLCLHETAPCGNSRISVLTVANPITGETRVLPPVPKTLDSSNAPGTHIFSYHPITGRYKVVHVPARVAQSPARVAQPRVFDAVQVLTIGDSESWRGVPLLSRKRSCRDNAIVSVDGSIYWLTARADQIMALDLEDESTTFFDAPPPLQSDEVPAPTLSSQLTNVHARLGVAVWWHERAVTRVEVWALESHREGPPRWSLRYHIIEPSINDQIRRWFRSCILSPHFTYGEHVLSGSSFCGRHLYRHKLGDRKNKDGGNSAPLDPLQEAELIMSEVFYGGLTTFAYVETHEPLPSIQH